MMLRDVSALLITATRSNSLRARARLSWRVSAHGRGPQATGVSLPNQEFLMLLLQRLTDLFDDGKDRIEL